MNRNHPLLLVVGTILLFVSGWSKPPEKRDAVNLSAVAAWTDNTTYINANTILMFVTNHGNFARDLAGVFGYDAGTFFPYSSIENIQSGVLSTCVLYAAGPWIAGKVNGETRIAIAEYADEYIPGAMANGTFQPDDPVFRVYKLHKDSLASNPNADYLNWPADQGAPVDAQGDPLMIGDQMLWTVFNDADPSQHSNNSGNTEPLGIEVQQTVWASMESGNIEIPIQKAIAAVHVGSSAGKVVVEVVDAASVTGHQYVVRFEDDAVLGSTWNLVDVTTGATLLTNQTNQSGEGYYEVVDGIRVVVYGGRLGVKSEDMYSDPGNPQLWGWDIPGGTRRFGWVNADGFGWEGFRGALGWGGPGDTHGFGIHDPVPARDLVTVLLKLAPADANGNFDPSHENVSYAYRYGRGFSNPPAKPEFAPFIINGGSYSYQNFEKSCPVSAWNVDVSPPQRLTVGYLENNVVDGLVDGRYWPPYRGDADNTASSGPREWLWIYLDGYSETPNPDYQLNAIDDPMPIMYWATWARRDTVAWEDGDQFLIRPRTRYMNTPADTFTFTATVPQPIMAGQEGLSIYVKYKLYNKGSNSIDSCYFSMWTDPDLGLYSNDLVGCDTLDDVFFCYDADDSDPFYGSRSPAVGFKILYGPLVPSTSGEVADFEGRKLPGYRNLPMTSFQKYINGTDPDDYVEAYNYIKGLNADGSPFPNGTNFALPGDPVAGSGDLDSDPADRRMMASCGPFVFNPGDSQYVLLRFAVGQGSDRLNSITVLRDILNAPFDYPTDINDDRSPELPVRFSLRQNYPNPFNPVTTIEYSLPRRSEVSVLVYNILGQQVRILVNETKPAGSYQTSWDGKDQTGKQVSTGVYLCRFQAGDYVETKKMLVLK